MGIKGKLARVIRKGTECVTNKISQAADKIKSSIHQWKTDAFQRLEDGIGVVKTHLFLKPLIFGLVILFRMIVVVMRGVNWVTEKVAGVLKMMNGLLTVGPLRFQWGREIAKKLPFGETLVALLECFGKLIGTCTSKTKEVLKYFTVEATSVMRLKYGDEVARLFQDVLISFGLALNMSWDLVQILDPIGLPLDSVELFNDFYDQIHIHDVEDEIKKFVPMPDNIAKINKIVAMQALALEEEKKKKVAYNQKKEVSYHKKNVASVTHHYVTSRATYQKKPTMVLA
ncbi:hypothetical protein SUGI_0292010 [Cryptomeria japonica]|uniref:uncharacterized protein LOC131030627 n=1 Tax=Cryptomeria japonica TaxID=3369 RepID=UPI00240898E5|nr:uncharacterized protein LOC131030627 [Cryptomeria japonica]GLJ16915.1 hypothetical protein SUGI_0292010 [Cryptomeria japonica]